MSIDDLIILVTSRWEYPLILACIGLAILAALAACCMSRIFPAPVRNRKRGPARPPPPYRGGGNDRILILSSFWWPSGPIFTKSIISIELILNSCCLNLRHSSLGFRISFPIMIRTSYSITILTLFTIHDTEHNCHVIIQYNFYYHTIHTLSYNTIFINHITRSITHDYMKCRILLD